MAMKWEQIKERYDAQLQRLEEKTDQWVIPRVQQLCRLLYPTLRITGVNCGMGIWNLTGDPCTVQGRDGDRHKEKLVHIVNRDWVGGSCQQWDLPVGIRPADFPRLAELRNLLDWWVDTTGGVPIEIDLPETCET